MTAALILMTSACVAGSDCGGCAAPAASCSDPCARVSCMDKMKARMALWSQKSKKADCCDPCAKPAPTCCAPAPAPAPTCCAAPAPACEPKCRKSLCDGSLFKKNDRGCDPCAKPSLLDRLKACFHHKKDCCETSNDCCSTAPATPAAPATPTAPAPKPIPPTGKTTKLVVPSQILPVSGNTF